MAMTDKQVRSTLLRAFKLIDAGQGMEAGKLFAKLVAAGIRFSNAKVGTSIKDTVIHRVAAAGK
jgi:hypothetical protein